MIPWPGTTRAALAKAPLKKAKGPSFRSIWPKQSRVLSYNFASVDCMRVFTTSKGEVVATENSPAPNPPMNVRCLGSFASASPVRNWRHCAINKNREPWLPPCFRHVAPSPAYKPATPSVLSKWGMPCRRPMFRLISFVFIVSCGVTTRVASQMPAHNPARKLRPMDTFPVFLSANWFRKNWFAPKRTPAFGALKMSTGVKPV